MRYPIALLETVDNLTKVHSLWVDANNDYEAVGKAIRIGNKLFPSSRVSAYVIDPNLATVDPDDENIHLIKQ